MSLILPNFVDQYSGILLSLHCDPMNYHQCLSLFKLMASIVFGVPFHSPQSNSELQRLKLPMIVHFTTMQVKPHSNCIACTNFLALSAIACMPHFPTSSVPIFSLD